MCLLVGDESRVGEEGARVMRGAERGFIPRARVCARPRQATGEGGTG